MRKHQLSGPVLALGVVTAVVTVPWLTGTESAGAAGRVAAAHTTTLGGERSWLVADNSAPSSPGWNQITWRPLTPPLPSRPA
jgi:hypothetical protein